MENKKDWRVLSINLTWIRILVAMQMKKSVLRELWGALDEQPSGIDVTLFHPSVRKNERIKRTERSEGVVMEKFTS